MQWAETFAADPHSASRARQFVRRLLGELPDELVARVVLMVSELATNAVQHAGGDAFELRVATQGRHDHVRIEARDSSDLLPAPAHTGTGAGHGRGLHIVRQLAERWGWERVPGGKVIWFEVQPCDDGDGGTALPPADSRYRPTAPSGGPARS